MENKINWKNAIIAGVLGTILFDIAGLILAGQWWDVPALLGEKTGLGMGYGIFGHYANGVLLGILYAGIAPSLWGPNWLRPFIFMAGETIALVWFFMFPLLGAGIAGVKMDPMVPVASMIRHLLFAVPFIFLIKPRD
ncbi:MAG: hypothetical protein JSS73_14815 [Bacteroidetes bacterium]|nr:hypothetical protein [Bacteroidota bacterium]